jgi:hypothetical protein
MALTREQPKHDDVAERESRANDLVKRIRKLRWMGMEDEAERLQSELTRWCARTMLRREDDGSHSGAGGPVGDLGIGDLGLELFQQERRLKSHHAIDEKTGRFVIARSQRVRHGRPDVGLRDGAIQFACKNLDCFAPLAITLLYL